MASSSLSGSRSRSSNNSIPGPRCFHGEIAQLRTVWVSGPTFGKRFYGCDHNNANCGFLKWVDYPDEVAELQHEIFERDVTIAGLEYEKGDLGDTVKRLRERNWKLEEEVAELAIESCVKLEAIEQVKYDKKLLVLLFLSWMLFAIVLLIKSA